MSAPPDSSTPPPGPAPAAPRARALSWAAAAALALLAVAHGLSTRRAFAPIDAVIARYGFAERRPDEVAALRLEPSAGLAAAMLTEMALEDVTGSVRLAGLDPARQRAWIESVAERTRALRDAQGLLLTALRSRPGWSYLRYLLGRAELAASASSSDRLWATLQSAAEALPGLDAAWVSLGAVALERWPGLSPKERELGLRALRRAFADETFVRAALPTAVAALGKTEALALLPEEPAPLAAALEEFSRRGDAAAYSGIEPRWRAAARRLRARQLSDIEVRADMGDLPAVADACRVWAETHRGWTLDDPEALRQALRVLELWPRLSGGSWDSDHRGELIRFFLNGREDAARGGALVNAMEALSLVPDPVRARVYLLAGDEYAFDAILRSSASAGSFDWTPVFAAVARREIEAGRVGTAREALSRIPATAGGVCEVLLVRRALARATGDRPEQDDVDLRLAAETAAEYPPDAWSPTRTLLLCVDPDAVGDRTLRVGLTATSASYVEWGWNGARSGGVFVPPGAGSLDLPLTGRAGRVVLNVWDRAGGPTKIDRTTVTRAR